MPTIEPENAARAIRITARMLMENRDRMTRQASDLTAAAKAAGHDIDTRIQYAEGSAQAYSVALSILAGAAGFSRVADLVGDWTPPRDPLPPMLPDDGDGTQTPPDDIIARASVRAADATIVDETRPEPRHG